jgi:Ca2+-binding EF-hand superfamily protein
MFSGGKDGQTSNMLASLQAMAKKYNIQPKAPEAPASSNVSSNKLKRQSVYHKDTYSNDQLEGYRAIFDVYDVDHSGGLDLLELTTMFTKLGVISQLTQSAKGEIKNLFQGFAAPGSDQMSFVEFLPLICELQTIQKAKEAKSKLSVTISDEKRAKLQEVYNQLDSDGEGTIDKDEFRACLSQLGIPATENEADELFTCLDLNNNGNIDFEEFLQVMVAGEPDESGKVLSVREVVDARLKEHHEALKRKKKSVAAGKAAGRRSCEQCSSLEEIGENARKATLVASGTAEDAAEAKHLSMRAAINSRSAELYKMSEVCDLEGVEELLGLGADPNWKNPVSSGRTPLHAACANTKPTAERSGCVTALMERADASILDDDCCSALYYSTGCDQAEVTEMLLDHEPPLDLNLGPTDTASSPLIRCCAFGHHKQAQALIGAGADVNLVNRDGTTALMKGVQNGRWECSCLLVQNKADLSIEDRLGKSALDWAEKQGEEMIVEMLQRAGAKRGVSKNPFQQAKAFGRSRDDEVWMNALKQGDEAAAEAKVALKLGEGAVPTAEQVTLIVRSSCYAAATCMKLEGYSPKEAGACATAAALQLKQEQGVQPSMQDIAVGAGLGAAGVVARAKGNPAAAAAAAAEVAKDAGAMPEECALAAASGAALIVDLFKGTDEEMNTAMVSAASTVLDGNMLASEISDAICKRITSYHYTADDAGGAAMAARGVRDWLAMGHGHHVKVSPSKKMERKKSFIEEMANAPPGSISRMTM